MPGFCEETFLVMIPLCLSGNHSRMKTPLAGSATGMSGQTGGLNQDSWPSNNPSKLGEGVSGHCLI